MKKIRLQALKKWDLSECLIIHRIGRLNLGEKIVLVITSSSHRSNSIEACEYVIDSLKIDVAFLEISFIRQRRERNGLSKKIKIMKKMLKWREIIN